MKLKSLLAASTLLLACSSASTTSTATSTQSVKAYKYEKKWDVINEKVKNEGNEPTHESAEKYFRPERENRDASDPLSQ